VQQATGEAEDETADAGDRRRPGGGLRRAAKVAAHGQADFERLRSECGYAGGYTVVKDYVRLNRARIKETFVPLSHSPDFDPLGHGATPPQRQVITLRIKRTRVGPARANRKRSFCTVAIGA
jgi:hypothetical protein